MRFKIILAALVAFTLPSCQPSKETAKPPVRIGEDVKRLAVEMLGSLDRPVTLQITRGGEGENAGEEAQALVDLVASVSPEVTVKRLEMATSPGAKELGVSHGPVIEMIGKAPGTLRYYGYPERKETRPFFEGILSASGRPAELPPAVRSFFKDLDEEVLIRIFTTPD